MKRYIVVGTTNDATVYFTGNPEADVLWSDHKDDAAWLTEEAAVGVVKATAVKCDWLMECKYEVVS